MNLFKAYLGADHEDKATIFCPDRAFPISVRYMTKGVQRADDPDYPALKVAEVIVNHWSYLEPQVSMEHCIVFPDTHNHFSG